MLIAISGEKALVLLGLREREMACRMGLGVEAEIQRKREGMKEVVRMR